MTTSTPSLEAAIAATRFGLGAKPGEIARAGADPRGFLKAQIRASGADQPSGALKDSRQMLSMLGEYKDQKQQRARAANAATPENSPDDGVAAMVSAPSVGKPAKGQGGIGMARAIREEGFHPEILARARLQATTDAAFRERWTLFWANHFTTSAARARIAALVGPFEREAIRPHVFGRFEDMLVASSQHPAMLMYLDQASAAGPNSEVGARGKRGLNENLAREIMELHTVGLGAGYSQADVTEFARALTGWSSSWREPSDPRPYYFRETAHEPGPRTIMGRTYAEGGEAQARAVLHDLAAHPQTARHVSTLIARHFVADDPPPALVARLESAWRQSDGRLDVVAHALIDAPEAWAPEQRKFKSPNDFLLSSWRAVGFVPEEPGDVIHPSTMLGQSPMAAPSPKGWPEEAATWAAPGEIVKRIDWAQGFAARTRSDREPGAIGAEALGPLLTPAASTAMARAESRPQALAILLMSPEFQRR